MFRDRQVTTWLSKQPGFDYNDVVALSSEESDYVIICIRPDERALLLFVLNWYIDFRKNWHNFPDETTRLDLIARANESLMVEMACSEDVQLIIDNLASIALSQTEIRDNISAQTTATEAKFDALNTEIAAIKVAIEALDPTLFDDIEETINSVTKILGGAAVGLT